MKKIFHHLNSNESKKTCILWFQKPSKLPPPLPFKTPHQQGCPGTKKALKPRFTTCVFFFFWLLCLNFFSLQFPPASKDPSLPEEEVPQVLSTTLAVPHTVQWVLDFFGNPNCHVSPATSSVVIGGKRGSGRILCRSGVLTLKDGHLMIFVFQTQFSDVIEKKQFQKLKIKIDFFKLNYLDFPAKANGNTSQELLVYFLHTS